MRAAGNEAALDANALQEWLISDAAVVSVIGTREVCVPSVVAVEALWGWLRVLDQHQRRQDEVRYSRTSHTLVELIATLKHVRILDYDETSVRLFSSLRTGRGNRSRNDLRIAATCIAHDVPLITRNARDFEDIPELRLETW